MEGKLVCRDIRKQYKDFSLKSISFEIEKGYLTGMAGVNGAGKSTLINILAGVDMDYDGEVSVDGLDLKKDYAKAKQKIGIVSEHIVHFLDETPLRNGELLGKYFEKWSMESFYLWMDKLELPKGLPLGQLSKGMYMKYQLAFVLAYEAEYLLLDEPTSGFDPVFRKDFMRMLQDIRDQGTGILMSTHITSDIEHIADYTLLLEDGKLVNRFSEHRGSISDLLRRNEVK